MLLIAAFLVVETISCALRSVAQPPAASATSVLHGSRDTAARTNMRNQMDSLSIHIESSGLLVRNG